MLVSNGFENVFKKSVMFKFNETISCLSLFL